VSRHSCRIASRTISWLPPQVLSRDREGDGSAKRTQLPIVHREALWSASASPNLENTDMLPKEHGAYAQLLFPIVTAIAIARPTAIALMFAAAAVLAFLAHEPLLVLLGQRGPRAGRDDGTRAVSWFASTASAAGVLLAAALTMASPAVRAAAIAPAVLAALLAAAVVAGRGRTTAGELLAAGTFASQSFLVARAAGASSHAALSCASVFAAAFIASTVSVHAVIGCTRRPPAAGARAAAVFVPIASLVALRWMAADGLISSIAPLAALPVCVVAALAAMVAPGAAGLRRLGWTLVAATSLSAVLLIVVFG